MRNDSLMHSCPTTHIASSDIDYSVFNKGSALSGNERQRGNPANYLCPIELRQSLYVVIIPST